MKTNNIFCVLVLALVVLSSRPLLAEGTLSFAFSKDTVYSRVIKQDSFLITNYTDDTLRFDSLTFRWNLNKFGAWYLSLVEDYDTTLGYGQYRLKQLVASGDYFPSDPLSDPIVVCFDSLFVMPHDSAVINRHIFLGFTYPSGYMCPSICPPEAVYPLDTMRLAITFYHNGTEQSLVVVGLYDWNYVGTEDLLSLKKSEKHIYVNPNPFSPQTTISFSGALDREPVKLNIIDPTGRVVRTMSGSANGGKVSYVWDGTDKNGKALARGVYVANVVGKGVNMKKLLVLTK